MTNNDLGRYTRHAAHPGRPWTAFIRTTETLPNYLRLVSFASLASFAVKAFRV